MSSALPAAASVAGVLLAVEVHHPGIDSLRLTPQVARAWTERLAHIRDTDGQPLRSSFTGPRLRGPGRPRLGVPANDSRPGWPNRAKSQLSPARSSAGSVSARRASRAIALSSARAGLPGTTLDRQGRDRRCLLAAHRVADRPQGNVFHLGPPWTRCWTPKSTSMTTCGGSPHCVW